MKTAEDFVLELRQVHRTGGSMALRVSDRDAEHRAELLKLQDDLLQGANREVMAAALIERLKGELVEAELRLAALEAKGEPGTHLCDHPRLPCSHPSHPKGVKP